MQKKTWLLILILFLILTACGKKGPVRPVDSSVPDSSRNATGIAPKECCN